MTDEPEKHLIVAASNPQQMQVAQQDLVVWAQNRLATIDAERTEAQANLEAAKAHKWKHTPFVRIVAKLTHQYEYYEKLKDALAAGYTIIPPHRDIDIFAIRTTQKRPARNETEREVTPWGNRPVPADQITDAPPSGDGKYVNATAQIERVRLKNGIDALGKEQFIDRAWTTKFDDVAFPFLLVKPEILNSTKQAMDWLFFDDIGCVPGRRRARQGADPMIIGRIHEGPWRYGSPKKTVYFLISWFVNTKDL